MRSYALDAKGFRPYYELALVQLADKDREGYQKTCRAMLERFKDTKDVLTGEFTVWTCSLAPDALADYAPAMALRPKQVPKGDAFSLQHRGAILFRAGRYLEALKALEECHAQPAKASGGVSQTSPAYACYLLAMVHGRLGLADKSSAWLKKANESAARELSKKGDASARPPWNRPLTLEILRAEAEQTLAAGIDSKSQVVMRERALWFAAQADAKLAQRPQTAQAWAAVGAAMCAQQRWPEYAATCTEALRLDPDNFAYFHRRGDARNGAGQWDEAIEDFTQAIRRKPDHVWSYWGRGMANSSKSRWELVIADCTRAIELEPHAGFYSHRAAAYNFLGEFGKAIADCNSALKLDSKEMWSYQRRGWALAYTGRWPEAAADYAKAVESAPTHSDLWLHYGGLLLLAGQPQKYQALCRDLVQRHGKTLDPTLANYLVRLCTLAPGGADPAQLIRWAELALAEQPGKAWRLHALAFAYYRAGKYEQALKKLDESNAAKWDAKVLNWLLQALGHQRLGQVEEARRWADKAFRWIDQAILENRLNPADFPSLEDVLEGHILRREVEALLGKNSPSKR